MAEYIEREVLFKKALEEKRFVFQTENLLNNELVVKTVYKDFAEFVNSIPAADVVPVVHGRWEHLEQGWIDLWRCSACGDEWTFEYDPTDSETKVNYCPNCGAHMKDGE